MYNHNLDVFKAAAEYKSFNRASEKLFITHTAVKKIIDKLEKQYDVKLFVRTNHGVELTKSGEILYKELPHLQSLSKEILQKVQMAKKEENIVIRIGTSTLFPYTTFMPIWEKISYRFEKYTLQVVSLEEKVNSFAGIGHEYDFQVGPHDVVEEPPYLQYIPIGKFRFEIAVPRKCILSSSQCLSLEDLSGMKVMIMSSGRSPYNDLLSAEIRNYPAIQTIEVQAPYTMDTFNRCAEENSCIVIPECWRNIHPSLVSVPLQEDFLLPYGVIASAFPDENAGRFLEVLKQTIKAE